MRPSDLARCRKRFRRHYCLDLASDLRLYLRLYWKRCPTTHCVLQVIVFIIRVFAVVPVLKTRLAQKPKDYGAPTLLFISGAALRVIDVTRIFKSTTLRGEKGGDIAKLFARHSKLEEHVQYVKRTRIGVAVGTPGRIGKLLCDTGAY